MHGRFRGLDFCNRMVSVEPVGVKGVLKKMYKWKLRAAEAVRERLMTVFPGTDLPAEDITALLEYPPEADMGDLALPCFKLSKLLRRSPAQISAALAEGDAVKAPGIERIEAAGGYLNFYYDRAFFSRDILCEILTEGNSFGRSREGEGKTVVLDYSSPNVAKPFHIGHLGTTVIGHSLRLLHEFCGYRCVGINHLGDWGTQFGKLIVAYRLWGSRESIESGGIEALVQLYVKFHTEAEKDPKLDEQAREAFHALETGDEEARALWKWFIEISLREYEKTYRQLGITFDSYNGESFYTDKMPAVVEELKRKNLMRIDDGASIVDLEAYGMPPCLILKKDGSTLYPTRDIAAAIYRKQTYHFDKCIYVTSAGQSLHFAQWFKVVELMGYDFAHQLVHVPYGTVSLNGEKLATRTGNVILLRDLFDLAIEKVKDIMKEKNPNLPSPEETAEAVGVGAIVFYYLSNNRMRDINFVLEDALSFDGNTGPYAQYTYARTCSILEKADAEDPVYSADMETGEVGEEIFVLAKVLARFPEKIRQALEEYEPSVITRYIIELCTAFNRMYHNQPILKTDNSTERNFRVGLVRAVNLVLGNALSLICMKKTEKI